MGRCLDGGTGIRSRLKIVSRKGCGFDSHSRHMDLMRQKLAYLIGIALGDGNLSNPNGRAVRLRITCFSGYPRITKEITETMHLLFPRNKVSIVLRGVHYFDISVYSNELVEWMPWKADGGSKLKQHAHVPDWILDEPAYARECLRGLIQSDGCIYTDRGYHMVNFVNACHELATDVHRILEQHGYRPTFHKINNGGHTKYSVRVARKGCAEKLMTELNLYKS